jgi:hypothetical protein
MQTIIVDNTTYKVKFDRDPIELAKLARKPYKTKKPKDIRKFPTYTAGVTSTAEYIKRFDSLNCLQALKYHGASAVTAAQYDSSIPLFEVLNDE